MVIYSLIKQPPTSCVDIDCAVYSLFQRTSSADNTPEKKVVLKSDSTSKRSTHTPSSAARFVPVGDERYSDYASEGEITSSVSISAILSKLDSLKVCVCVCVCLRAFTICINDVLLGIHM